MPNEEISQIQLPNGDVYDIRDGNVSDFKINIDEETLSDGQILKYNEETGEWENIEEVDPTDITNTASGSIATFTDGGDNIPVKSFECEIVAQQASGTPTPVSSLLITGFSQADITVTDNDQITNLYTVAFGQTVYGGRLIYSNGQWAIRATHEILTLDGTESISLTGSDTNNRRFRFNATFTYNAIPLSSHFIEGTSNANPWGYYRFISKYLILNDNNVQMADETALKTWLANQYSGGTPVQFLGELATPVIIPITSSTRIKTISGANNIFSNTGDVSLEYFTDKADEIAELVEEEIASMSADYHAYSTDEQIVGRWIDGSTIYEKTFTATFTNIAQNTPQDMVDVSGLGIADIIRVFGSCKYDSTTPSVQPTLYEGLGGHFYCYVFPSGYLQFGQAMTAQTTGRTYEVKVTLQYTKSSNTRNLNLSKGSSEELPVEEKKEVKEVQDE